MRGRLGRSGAKHMPMIDQAPARCEADLPNWGGLEANRFAIFNQYGILILNLISNRAKSSLTLPVRVV